MLVVNTLNKIN